MLSKIVSNHYDILAETYDVIMGLPDTTFRYGARGVLFKLIFDELGKNGGNEESCWKKIGVLDLLNRKNNKVSISRILLSYLSNYTETKCDSARNSVKMSEIIQTFENLFDTNQIKTALCNMFELRNTKWTHLVSFNQIEYQNNEKYNNLGEIDLYDVNPEKTMIHYSCAGKIYLETVTTHYEFFTSRVFNHKVPALFCKKNIEKNSDIDKYEFDIIIDTIYTEVEKCCISLKSHNENITNKNQLKNPYDVSTEYANSAFVCLIKSKDNNSNSFKQFHEDRLINTHIVYLDKFRLYVLNHIDEINVEEKKDINARLVNYITKYVNLLESNMVLKRKQSMEKFVPHYKEKISLIQMNLGDFTNKITYESNR